MKKDKYKDPYTGGRQKKGLQVLLYIAIIAGIAVLVLMYIKHKQDDAQVQAELNKVLEARQAAAEDQEADEAELEEIKAEIDEQYSVYEKLAVGYDIDVLVIGDSIAAGYTTEDSGGTTIEWYSSAASYLRETYMYDGEYSGSVGMENIALNRSTSYAGYVRNEILDDDVDYDLVIICYGTYDDTENLSLYYEALLRSVLAKYENCSVISVIEASLTDEKVDKIEELCEYYSVPVVDMVSVYEESGYSYDDLTGSDGITPNSDGYDLYCEAVCDVIDENVELASGKTELPDPYDSAAAEFESFAIYLEGGSYDDAQLERTDELTYTLYVSGTGVLGIGFYCELGSTSVDVYIDGVYYDTVTVESDIDASLKTILPLDGSVTIEAEVSLVFETEENADGFYCFALSGE